jgi:hypothetical protein
LDELCRGCGEEVSIWMPSTSAPTEISSAGVEAVETIASTPQIINSRLFM